MKLKLTPKFVLTFLALTFVLHEAHEIVHTTVGRIICGCWGERDFNVWGLCDSCQTNPLRIYSTLAGPVFTFIIIWFGNSLLNSQKSENQWGRKRRRLSRCASVLCAISSRVVT